jgi:hypothetical protein
MLGWLNFGISSPFKKSLIKKNGTNPNGSKNWAVGFLGLGLM